MTTAPGPMLAINLSPAALELRRASEPAFRVWKTSAKAARVEAARSTGDPFIVHFGFDADDLERQSIDWDGIADLLAESCSPCVNLHLKARRSRFVASDRRAVRDRCLRAIGILTSRFGSDRVALENVTVRPDDDRLPECGDPEFISEVVRAAGCGFILDLAHAAISAETRGEGLESYLEGLPGDHLRELHATGAVRIDGAWVDGGPMAEDDWAALDGIADWIRRGRWRLPDRVILESGGMSERKSSRIGGRRLAIDARRLARWTDRLTARESELWS